MTTLFTIGYEGSEISLFIDQLLEKGVRVLADVRALPLSRKPGFSKTRLSAHVEEVGIRYHHFPELGDPKEGRQAARAGNHTEFRRIYISHLLGRHQQLALNELARIAANDATSMMCFEREPRLCHRSIIAERMRECGLTVHDIFPIQLVRDERRAALQPRRYLGEGTAPA